MKSMRYHIKLKQYGDNETHIVQIRDSVRHLFSYSSTVLNTDSEGWIISPLFEHKTNKIFFLSDSFIENSYVREGNRICDILNINFIKEQMDYCIFNGSMSGSSLLHLYNLYMNKIANKSNVTILLLPGMVNVSTAHVPNTFWQNGKFTPFDINSKDHLDDRSVDRYDTFIKLLELFYASTHIFSHRFILLTLPYSRLNNTENSWACEQINLMNDIITQLASRYNIMLIDLNKYKENTRSYFYDFCHINSDGSQLYADYIYRFIKPYLY